MKPTLEDFIILKVIGRGIMGKVMLVRHKETKKLYALKSIHKEWIISHGQIQHAKSERDILAAFRDSIFNIKAEKDEIDLAQKAFLIKLHASFQTSTEIFYVLDFMVGGDLASILAKEIRLGEMRSKFLAAEIAIGLNLLHSKGIIYRDLKPENVLLDSRGHVVLTDFGLSKILTNNPKTNTFCGTAEYLAPEILKGESYDKSVDWWSFGTMLYEMITGMTPYWNENANIMYRRILLEDRIEFPSFVGIEARDIIIKLLSRIPSNRPTFESLKQHNFFSTLDWKSIESRSSPGPINVKQIDEDTSAFDTEFTHMQPAITPVDAETVKILNNPESQEAFSGFSYYPGFE